MTGAGEVYAFRSFRVDEARRLLLRNGCPVSVTAKIFDLLVVLIRSRERVVTRAELMQQLWPDTTVEDGNLSVGISALRKALGADSDDAPIIETLPRVGYRFVADVSQESPEAAQRESMASEPPVPGRAETGALAMHLPAKVLCPDTGGAILRERLFRALDERSQSPITWLHAPAGSGKTMLLSTYLRARQVPMLWYDVDAGDTDASSVFHYTIASGQVREAQRAPPRGEPPSQNHSHRPLPYCTS